MGLIQREIAPGVRFNYLETDKFKTNFLSVSFVAPLSRETAAVNALIPMILLRGCEKYPSMAEINRRLDYLYASGISSRNLKRGDCQIFGLCAGMIDRAYTIGGEDIIGDIADLLEDILLHPILKNGAFDPAYIESEKHNLIDNIRAAVNNKGYYAKLRCIEEMCRNERFGLSENGTEEEAAACTPESVYAGYRYALAHDPIEIYFVGHVDDIVPLCNRFAALFDGIERTPDVLPSTEIIRTAGEVRRVTEDMPVNQGKLVMGFRSGITLHDTDYPALVMFNAMFGGALTSKLFMNVREKMSLCYYCQSSADAAKGILTVQSGIEVENREVAEKAILEQLTAMQQGDFNEEEFQGALLSMTNSYREMSDSARGLENWYLVRGLDGVVNSPDDVAASLAKVSREEVIAASKKAIADTFYFLNGTKKDEDENEEGEENE